MCNRYLELESAFTAYEYVFTGYFTSFSFYYSLLVYFLFSSTSAKVLLIYSL